jgi:ketosteroid isomerase-like protein
MTLTQPDDSVTTAFLDAFAQAWNRHDLDALMTFMTEDCVFQSWMGPDACGTRYVGQVAVRAGFQRAWQDVPDAQWHRAQHLVMGDRGLSEWVFTGTHARDGRAVEVHGCDLFTFHDGRIRIKDSWRKVRA